MPDRYKALLLFGPPGAGKGTQGKMLGSVPGMCHLSTGDMFRGMDRSSDLGKEIVGYMSAGELVPDELTVKLFGDHVRERVRGGQLDAARDVLVLDGIPRSVAQAKLLEPMTHVLGVIHLVAADRGALVERLRGRALKENRPDDAKPDVVQRRLEVYDDETRPVLGHYSTGLIHEVEALGLPSRVLLRVLERVVPILEGLGRA